MAVEQNEAVAELADNADNAADQLEKKRKKKKDKVRSAWISFVGRIVAQIMGAAATISLGLMLVQKYQSPAASVLNVETPAQVVPARQATPGERSLAVLPLQNFSADTEDSFADAMTEALITDLSRIDDVRVLSRTSSMLYKKHNNKTLPAIARELGVDMILEGSVTKAEGRVRITAQLIDARSDEHIWADDYERPMRELLSVQAEVATAIARSVRSAIASGPRKAQKVALR